MMKSTVPKCVMNSASLQSTSSFIPCCADLSYRTTIFPVCLLCLNIAVARHTSDPIRQHARAVHAIKVGYSFVNPFPPSLSSSLALPGVMDVRPYINREVSQLDILAHLLRTSCDAEGNIATPHLACNAPVSPSTTNKKVNDIAISTKFKHAMYIVGGLCYTT